MDAVFIGLIVVLYVSTHLLVMAVSRLRGGQ
jgi:hypothetical protein